MEKSIYNKNQMVSTVSQTEEKPALLSNDQLLALTIINLNTKLISNPSPIMRMCSCCTFS